ncbi:Imm51 family immunity protein [Micromonospora mirobrigensis]|uniref:Immunity protein 51 n=1 Tax=Micromonospora mirobrigensis TaxID=262898 RepID=A0A1C4WNA4_9ACTN|nr:Imm51 family immunity protein [Micromonospora mirobrigensis]SCE97737.1 Immunity protein 51 [Micromonospora mirobrigensis]
MDPVEVARTGPGEYSLTLAAGTTEVDDLISELGHEPNGYFWEGIVELLVSTEVPALDGRFVSDPEGGAYFATGEDRQALDELAVLLRAVAADRDRLRRLVAHARATGLEFDD